MNLKLWTGILLLSFGLAVGVSIENTMAATSYVGDEMSIYDGLMVYKKVSGRDGSGFVGIGITNINSYPSFTTPNLAVSGNVLVHGNFSSKEVLNTVSATSGTVTIDWNQGNNQRVDFQGAWSGAVNFAFTNPTGRAASILTLNLKYSNTSSTFTTFSWPSVKWPLGQAPILSTANLTNKNHTDTIYFFYYCEDGTNKYYGVRSYGDQ